MSDMDETALLLYFYKNGHIKQTFFPFSFRIENFKSYSISEIQMSTDGAWHQNRHQKINTEIKKQGINHPKYLDFVYFFRKIK